MTQPMSLVEYLCLNEVSLDDNLTNLVPIYRRFVLGLRDFYGYLSEETEFNKKYRKFTFVCDVTRQLGHSFNLKIRLSQKTGYDEHERKMRIRILGADSPGKEILESIDSLVAEVMPACQTIESRLKTDTEEYYKVLLRLYFDLREDFANVMRTSDILKHEASPMMIERETPTVKELKLRLDHESYEYLLRRLHSTEKITPKFIDDISRQGYSLEVGMHKIHEELLEVGRGLGKDELDVHLDANALIKLKGSARFYLPKKDKLVLILGIKELRSGGVREFVSSFADETAYKQAKRSGYKLLRFENKDPFFALKYKSHITGHSEEQDNEIIKQLKLKYFRYVGFSGDHLCKCMHGYLLFDKVLVVNVDQIKKDHPKAPESVIDGIIADIKGMVGRKEETILVE